MTEPERTIHDWANEIRTRSIEAYGEKEFAKLMLHFANLIEAVDSDGRLEAVLTVLATSYDAKALQLAVVWLDRKGYSETAAKALLSEIDKIRHQREAQSQDIQGEEWDYF